ncbi:hypothetical protein PS619_00092 [Pseudomonas fluorescens]|nr:hypothetical protein PS619_00092 [Pseudomonas fluorescens]
MMSEAILRIEIDVYCLFPFGITNFVDSAGRPCYACIVDKYIKPTHPLLLYLEDSLNLSRVGDVGQCGQSFRIALTKLCDRLLTYIAYMDSCPNFEICSRDRFSNA